MKNLLFICFIILFFSCKESHKGVNKTVLDYKGTIENTSLNEKTEKDYQNQIIPGRRLGRIVLNENATTILDSLGKPDSGDAAMGKAISTWHEGTNNQLSLYTSTKMGVENFSRIKAIRSLSPTYKTYNNLGVNSNLSEIEKRFELKKIGTFAFEEKIYTLYFTEIGMGFEVGENQKCSGIVLTEKGTEPDQLYLTFYPDLKKI